MNVVQVVPRLERGGAVRSAIDQMQTLSAIESLDVQFISLGKTDHAAVDWLKAAGMDCVPRTEHEHALRKADIIHVNFWNTPEMYNWLRAPMPPGRLIVSSAVAGKYPSQVVSRALVDFADQFIAATPLTLELPACAELQNTRAANRHVVPQTTTLAGTTIPAEPHTGIRVLYAGTVDFCKMHPRFVEMCAAVNHREVTFVVAGSGDGFKTLQRQAAAVNIESRFQWLGYRADVRRVIAGCDIFGYPLAPDTYAATDLILQEAMWLGVPPVIFAGSGISHMVQDRETGRVVADECAYAAAVQELCENAAERKRLGANARAYAQAHFGTHNTAKATLEIYRRAMQSAKRAHIWQGETAEARYPGASALVESFGDRAGAFRISLSAPDAGQIENAEREIAYSSPVAVNGGAGGILDYRFHYAQDAMLRLWAGLVLTHQKRFALAAAEFFAAQQLGLPGSRIEKYFAAAHAGHSPFASPPEHILPLESQPL